MIFLQSLSELPGAGSLPTIEITGWLTNTWFYVFLVGFIGFILVGTLITVLFFRTYNKRIIFFENISGQGYQPVRSARARSIRVGKSGGELLKLMFGGYMSAYGRKMGRNTYWYAKGPDGYWYNILLGDLESEKGILDVEPVDKDVRMFHVATANMNLDNYGDKKFWEKHGNMILAFVFMVVLVISMWVIIGKIGDATTALADTAEANRELTELNKDYLQAASNLRKSDGSTGIIPAGDDDGGG